MQPGLINAQAVALKSPQYFLHRFLLHPMYRYQVFLATGENHGPALFALRVARHGHACALRIVDFCGDPAAIAGSGAALKKCMVQEGAEYADFWQMGLDEQNLLQAGFAPVDPQGPVIVPNYFEPFVVSNARIWCAMRKNYPLAPDAIICRADGDQDRPNVIHECR